MRDLVVHSPSGLLLDFAAEDFGGDEQARIIQARRDCGRHAKRGEFICHQHRNRERPWLYLRQRGGLLIAAHWPGTALEGSHEISHGVSDEHKRQVKYIERAGTAAGFEVRTEVSLSTKVRPDAIIYGPHKVGVEVQRSQLTPAAAKARTTKAHRAGVESLWFSDRGTEGLPWWFFRIPSVAAEVSDWKSLPPGRSVAVASGVRVIVPKRCQDIRNGQCPQRRYGCNRWHPDHEPRRGLMLDDVAEMVPNGTLVPIQFRPFAGREYVLMVTAPDKDRYEELVGRSADLTFRERERSRPQEAGRVDCAADAGMVVEPSVLAAPRCPEHGTYLTQLVPGKLYCSTCHRVEMNARGRANYPVGQPPAAR